MRLIFIKTIAICFLPMINSVYQTVLLLIIGDSRSMFGQGQCQAGTAGDIIDGVYVITS